MLSVFSKRYLAAPVAGLLLSVAANASDQYSGQYGQFPTGQTQKGGCLRLDKPSVCAPSVNVVMTTNEATLSLVGDQDIEVEMLDTLIVRLTQKDGHRVADGETYPVQKCLASSSCDQAQQSGYQCGGLDVQLVSADYSSTTEGQVTGDVKYQNLRRYRITMRGGDSEFTNLPCEKTTVEDVMNGLPSELQDGLTLNDARSAVMGVLEKFRSGRTRVLKAKDTCKADVCHNSQGKELAKDVKDHAADKAKHKSTTPRIKKADPLQVK